MTEQLTPATHSNNSVEKHDFARKHAAVFIDVENFYFSRKRQYERAHPYSLYRIDELKNDLEFLIRWLKQQANGANFTAMRGYASFTKRFRLTEPGTNTIIFRAVLARAVDELMKLGIEPVLVPALTATKNAADMRLAIDASAFVEGGGRGKRVVIVSGDSDYIPLTSRLRWLGAEVIVIGLKDSTGQYVSNFADELFIFEDLLDQDRQLLEREEEARREREVSHTLESFRDVLARIEPRFVLVPFDYWITTTDGIYKWMYHVAPTSLNDLGYIVEDELAGVIKETSGVVRDVMNQLRDSRCFAARKNGIQLPDPIDEFQQDVGLADGIDSVAEMRKRTQEVITVTLRERLIHLHDPRPQYIAQ